MKTAIYLFSATLMGLSACSSAYHASNFENDDIYFTSKDALAEEMAAHEATQNELNFMENEENVNSDSYQDPNGYNDNPPADDYYDDNSQQRQRSASNSGGNTGSNIGSVQPHAIANHNIGVSGNTAAGGAHEHTWGGWWRPGGGWDWRS